jgi:hypothetical protein
MLEMLLIPSIALLVLFLYSSAPLTLSRNTSAESSSGSGVC